MKTLRLLLPLLIPILSSLLLNKKNFLFQTIGLQFLKAQNQNEPQSHVYNVQSQLNLLKLQIEPTSHSETWFHKLFTLEKPASQSYRCKCSRRINWLHTSLSVQVPGPSSGATKFTLQTVAEAKSSGYELDLLLTYREKWVRLSDTIELPKSGIHKRGLTFLQQLQERLSSNMTLETLSHKLLMNTTLPSNQWWIN